jgi:hypothetical protein
MTSIDMYGTIDDGKIMVGTVGVCTAGTTCCTGVQVWRTAEWPLTECCPQWKSASKPPTGQSRAIVAYSPADGSTGFAATSGDGEQALTDYDESAFSVSSVGDVGKYWNQISLIDTLITTLTDVAVNPECGTIYLFSNHTTELSCNCDSVWLSINNGGRYMRVWNKDLTGSPEVGLIRLAPEETSEVLNVYLVDQGTKIIYWNDASGLTSWTTRTVTTLTAGVQDLAVENKATVYALELDGDVSKTTNYGSHWATAVSSKVGTGHTIDVMVPAGNESAAVIVGPASSSAGKVGYSLDAGATYAKTAALTPKGDTHVTFDSYFWDNSIIYAATSGATDGVYRYQIGTSTAWKNLNANSNYDYFGLVTGKSDDTLYATYTCPVGGTGDTSVTYYNITCGADGTPFSGNATSYNVYGASGNWTIVYENVSSMSTDTLTCTAASFNVTSTTYTTSGTPDTTATGVARLLNPCAAPCCGSLSWDYLFKGLGGTEAFSLEPSSLKICGCLSSSSNSILWAIDKVDYSQGLWGAGSAGRLWYYEDCYSKVGVTLTSVADGTVIDEGVCAACGNVPFTLAWDRMCDACEYEFDFSLTSDFTQIVAHESSGWVFKSASVVKYYKPSNPATPTLLVPEGTFASGQTYYWRVRAHYAETGEVIRSPWSQTWSFSIASGATLSLTAPDNGATGVGTAAALGFTWTSTPDVSGVTYDFSLTDSDGTVVASGTGLDSASFSVSASDLAYDTTYFWTVTAKDASGNVVATSATSTFATESEPAAPPALPATPSWVWVVIAIGAILVIVTLVLIFRTRRV